MFDVKCTTNHSAKFMHNIPSISMMHHDAWCKKSMCLYRCVPQITHQKNCQTKKECQKRWVPIGGSCWELGVSPTNHQKGKSSSKKPKSFLMRHGDVGSLCRGWSYDGKLLQCLQGRVVWSFMLYPQESKKRGHFDSCVAFIDRVGATCTYLGNL